jgi:hypothetical protein
MPVSAILFAFGDPMETSVVVVHGVGDPLPGNALEKLIQGLSSEQWTQVEGTWIEHRLEAGQSDPAEVKTFPVARATLRKADASGVHTLHLREVYWGDLSRPKASLLGLVSALFDLIFGLRYIVAAAANELTGSARCVGQFARIALEIARGPMFALNILAALICGCYVLLASTELPWNASSMVPPPLAAVLVMSLLVVGAGFFIRSVAARLEWSQSTAIWMICSGLAVIVVALIFRADLTSDLKIIIGDAAKFEWGKFNITNFMVVGASVMAAFAVLALVIGGWFYVHKPVLRGPLNVVIFCMSLSLALFTFVVVTLWAVIGRAVREDTADRVDRCLGSSWLTLENCIWISEGSNAGNLMSKRIEDGIHLLPWLIYGFLGMAALFGVVAFSNWKMSKCESRSNKRRYRYLVNPWVAAFFVAFSLVYGVIFVTMFFQGDVWSGVKNDAAKPIALALVVFAVSVVVATQSHFLSALDLILDVIAHFRTDDYARCSRTGRHLVWERIVGRFRSVLDSERRSSDGERAVVVFSHSLGTAIAADGLGALVVGKVGDAREANVTYGAVRLVTMGSPITHLFRYYLPDRYHLRVSAVKSWLNIYRIDDFIGTRIDVKEIGEVNVGLGGHSNYWCDPRVVPYLAKSIQGAGAPSDPLPR